MKLNMQPILSFLRKAYPLFFIGAFLAVLILPLANLDFNPQALETSFFGRLRLIRAITDLRVAIGDRVFANAIIGKEGWIFQTSERVIQDYQNDMPFTEKQLSELQQNLDEVAAVFQKQGIALVVVVAPDKSSIYPDYMPTELQLLRPQSRFDQIVQYLKQHGKNQILDLRQELIAYRAEQLVYYKTDSHWTDYGAYIAYREILNALQPTHPELIPRALSEFKPESMGLVSMDLAGLIGSVRIKEEKIILNPVEETKTTRHDVQTDDGRWITMTWNPNKILPRAVIYYDSFLYPIIPWFNDQFSQITYIPHFTNASTWNLSWVNQMNADVVIVEITEKYIHNIATLVNPQNIPDLMK